jgi:hypothetical protein
MGDDSVVFLASSLLSVLLHGMKSSISLAKIKLYGGIQAGNFAVGMAATMLI